MQRALILCFAAALVLAAMNAAPAAAQSLPDMNYPDAPLSLEQDRVLFRLLEKHPLLFIHAPRKPIANWTQRDLEDFRGALRRVGPRGLNFFDEERLSIFFDGVFEGIGGGGEGDGGGDD